jgi:hypothetical protein
MAIVAGIDIVLTVNGKNVPIEEDELGPILYNILTGEDVETSRLLQEFAKSTRSDVLVSLAAKFSIDDATIDMLIEKIDEKILKELIIVNGRRLTQKQIDWIQAIRPDLTACFEKYGL